MSIREHIRATETLKKRFKLANRAYKKGGAGRRERLKSILTASSHLLYVVNIARKNEVYRKRLAALFRNKSLTYKQSENTFTPVVRTCFPKLDRRRVREISGLLRFAVSEGYRSDEFVDKVMALRPSVTFLELSERGYEIASEEGWPKVTELGDQN